MGHREKSFVVLECTSEGSSLVAEQLGTHRLGVVLTTRNRWPMPVSIRHSIGTVRTNPARQRRLASAALAQKEHWHIQLSKSASFIEDLTHATGLEPRGIPDDRRVFRRHLRGPGSAISLVVAVDTELDGYDCGTAVALLFPVRLDEHEGGIDETGLAHQHEHSLHGRRAGADMKDQFPVGKLSPHRRQLLPQEVEELNVIGRVISIPRLRVDSQPGITKAQFFYRLLEGA